MNRIDRLEEKIQSNKALKIACMLLWGAAWAGMFLAIIAKL